MNKEHTAALIENFPELYRDYYLPPTQSCMHWGFECGDGWFEHINLLSVMLSSYLKQNPEIKEGFRVNQVKEKYGTLRYYVTGGDEHTSNLIYLFEITSYFYCEKCGSTEDVKSTKGWISYLCKKCRVAKKETNCDGCCTEDK